MAESCSFNSPSLKLSNISDPDFVGRLCHPIINKFVPNEAFLPPLITQTIIPEIKGIIKNDKKNQFTNIPTIIHLMIDNYPEIGVAIVKTEIFAFLQNMIMCSGGVKAKDLSELFVEIASTIPRIYRDDIVVETIHKYVNSEDYKIRQLAVSLIPVVRDNQRVLQYFRSLANDKLALIRAAVVKALPNCTFNESIINYILINATRDSNIGVQQIATSLISSIAPQLINDYCRLLRNPDTVRYAFPQMPQIVANNSFTDVYNAFKSALKYDKNDAALALIETASKVDPNNESALYIKAASDLISFAPFTWRLFSFAENFSNKNEFLNLLDPKNIPDWRTRYALLKQAELFAPELKSSLVRYAEIYSEDPVATIRNESANLWCILLSVDPTIRGGCEERLLRGSWHKRMVLAKLIGLHGNEGFQNAIEKLSNDPVENVRRCIHENLQK
jgi:hypothetical protein